MKSYFKFSKSQKIGVVTVAIIVLVQIIILNKGNAVGVPDPFVMDASQYLIEKSKTYYSNKKVGDAINYSHVLYDFDPNKINVKEWVDFGFSEKQAKTIVSYKNKIGGFKKKEDLQNVYVISDSKYRELEPYVKILENTFTKEKHKYKKEPYVIEMIELNSASQVDLINLKGIGDYTAKGIIKYKDLLGGFHSVSQLKEVYGISDENFEKIKPQVEIDKATITKLNVNDLSIPELKKHPYITWKIANAIIDKRLASKLTSIQFLVDDHYITQEELEKLLPYITFM